MAHLADIHFFKKLAATIIISAAANQIAYSQEMTSPSTSPAYVPSGAATQPANGASTQPTNVPASANEANGNAATTTDLTGGGASAQEKIQNPLSENQNEPVTEAKDMNDFVNQAINCNQIIDRVLTYNVNFPGGGRIWIQASKTGFCRGAILPQPNGHLAICDFTKEELAGLFTPDVIERIKKLGVGPNTTNLVGMEKVLNPIINCYKKNNESNTANGTPTGANAGTTGESTGVSNGAAPVNQPVTEEKYNYSKQLQ